MLLKRPYTLSIKGENLKTQNIVEDIMDKHLEALRIIKESRLLEKYNGKDWINHFKEKMKEAAQENNRIKYVINETKLEKAEQIAARIRLLRAFPNVLDKYKYNEKDWINHSNHFKEKMKEAAQENNRIRYVINTTKLERAEQIAARIRLLRAFPKEEKLPIEKKKNEFIAMKNYPKKQKNQSWSDYYTQTTKFFENEGNIRMLERQILKRNRALKREEEAKQQPENTNKLNLSKSRSR